MPDADRPPVILVTGAARRIGAAIARTLHAAGCDLALHYHRSADDMQTLAAELDRRRPGSVHPLQADLADAGHPAALVAAAVDHFGRLDGLVNNASSYHATPLATVAADDWDALMATNARAPFMLSRAAADPLGDTHGAIVNITDYYAEHPRPDYIPYAASKAALVAVTRGLAAALAPAVRVNAIAPGAIAWPEHGLDEADKHAILDATALARPGTPGDIADTVRWLLLDAHYVTGQVIHVDGGRGLHGDAKHRPSN